MRGVLGCLVEGASPRYTVDNMMNTPQKGRYRWIVFKKGEEWIAAALEFNIVEVGEDPNVVYIEMQEAAKGYIEATQKLRRFRPQVVNPILNQEPEEEYEQLWNAARNSQQESDTFPENVFDFGIRNLAAV